MIDEAASNGKVQYQMLKKFSGQKNISVNKKYLPEYVDRHRVMEDETSGNIINIHDCNENFIFADYESNLPFGDISFVIKEEYECSQSFILRKV